MRIKQKTARDCGTSGSKVIMSAFPVSHSYSTQIRLHFMAKTKPLCTRPLLLLVKVLARRTACGFLCQATAGRASRFYIVVFQEHRPTEQVSTNKRFTVVCISEF